MNHRKQYKIIVKDNTENFIRTSKPYAALRCIKRCLSEKRNEKNINNQKTVITLSPDKKSHGRVLFSYINDGFLVEPGTTIPKTHTNIWQSLKMAETFAELGYEVDIIHYHNSRFLPRNQYSFFIDVRHNLQRLAPMMNGDCIKIMHIDTAHILFHNAAEANRLLQLQKRRGITLLPRRFEMPNLGIEHADCATTGGNDFTIDSFKYANKKIYRLPSPCGISIDWREKDWEECQKKFLWFSSSGFVHKGLDLALDAFREMPDLNLIVCSRLDKDKDFISVFHHELYETQNIQTIGWVDIDSKEFLDITSQCGAMLHLSCSEGGAPSVKMCMHAGLIPIVSYETAVDVDDFGYTLKDCSVENVKSVIRRVASLDKNRVRDKAFGAWEHARKYHTRERFSAEYRKVIKEISKDERNLKIRANSGSKLEYEPEQT
jgi:glycosyltransferase involved in cell wall biosynthesis